MAHSNSSSLAVVGCGAISELYYAPALLETTKHIPLGPIYLFDPSLDRRQALQSLLPLAQTVDSFDQILELKPNLAIVASPPRFHASQACALFDAGIHVLCEKPLASSSDEAQLMVDAAQRADRLLAVGMFRRFFPALQTIKSLISSCALGAVQSFSFNEGGVFNWPAASASFFQKESSQGGVLFDLGVHMLDLICWWFGTPTECVYSDDAMGNLEANCSLSLRFPSGVIGNVRLSRDTQCSNDYTINFQNGQIIWNVGDANQLSLTLDGMEFNLDGYLVRQDPPADNYHQCFVRQILNFVQSSQGLDSLVVPGSNAVQSLRLIEQCYSTRTLIPMPWLTDQEISKAKELNQLC